MLYRIGIFLLLIGGGLAALFVLSDIAGDADFDLIFLGGLCMAAGLFLR